MKDRATPGNNRLSTNDEEKKPLEKFYKYVLKKYPADEIILEGKNGEPLLFNRESIRKGIIYYYLRKTEEEKKDRDNKKSNVKALFSIDLIKKEFSFMTDFDYRNRGYGRTIFNSIAKIFETLNIKNLEEYQIMVNKHHPDEIGFFEKMKTEELLEKTFGEPDEETAKQMLQEVSGFKAQIKLKELNDILEYAIKSNVGMDFIADCLNTNGLNIKDYDGDVELSKEQERFRGFNISGLKPTSMDKNHFEINELHSDRDFKFLKIFGDGSISQEDTDDEFRNVYNKIQDEYNMYKNNNEKDIPYFSNYHKTKLQDIDKYGILGYIMLYCNRSGLLFKNASTELKRFVRLQAITMFGSFDPDHIEEKKSNDVFDENSRILSQVLCDAGLIDKNMYILLYQKALGRNYNLKEFESFMSRYTDYSFRKDARDEIEKTLFLPCPKGTWQKSNNPHEEHHRISKITIPKKVSEGKTPKELMKMLRNNLSSTKHIRVETDMISKSENGKIIEVDNLFNWYFGIPKKLGVPGVPGYLQINQDGEICLPPQTPQRVIEFVRNGISKELNSIEIE